MRGLDLGFFLIRQHFSGEDQMAVQKQPRNEILTCNTAFMYYEVRDPKPKDL